MWIICFSLSVGCVVLAAILSFVITKGTFAKKHNIGFLSPLFAGVFLSACFLFFPVYSTSEGISFWGDWRACLLAVLNAMEVFGCSGEFSAVKESVSDCPDALQTAYLVWTITLFVVAPLLSVGFILSLFKNLSARFKYFCSYFKDTYIFSDLNEKSLALAQDIKNRNQKVAIVFTNVCEGGEEGTDALVEDAKQLGAICFKKDIGVVNFKRHAPKKAIWFFAIGENEAANLNQSLRLIENYKSRKNTHMYVFSKTLESELLLTSIDKGEIKVRRINEVLSLINHVLYERGEMVFESAKPAEDGTKRISVVVVGMGRQGTEMLKALTWYGQMNGYSLEINAFDKDPLAEEKFTALAPELMSPKYNGVMKKGEAQYKITVHSEMDVASISFANEIEKIKDATYVVVALGNDDVNINTAVTLRMYFERMKIHPIIHAIVYNSQQKKALEGIKNYRGQAYNIGFIGDVESFYTEDVIINSELEEDALSRHLKWGKEEEFWTYEYNYRSSVASAIHRQARIKCGIPGAAKKENELTTEERDAIEALEHRRWNAYMRAEGYVYSKSKDEKSRNDLAKMHNDLIDYESLDEEEKRKDSRVGTD